MVLGICFLTLSYVDIQFEAKKLTWSFFTTAEALLITRQVELIDKQ